MDKLQQELSEEYYDMEARLQDVCSALRTSQVKYNKAMSPTVNWMTYQAVKMLNLAMDFLRKISQLLDEALQEDEDAN